MKILETERLLLRTLSTDDAEFYLRLVNEPSWLQYIGNRGVQTREHACQAILQGPVSMFQRYGFCLYLVELVDTATPIGLCGLIRRETWEEIDIGFAFFPEYWGCGYAYESASAVMRHAKDTLGLKRVLAIVSPDNDRSISLIEKLGMTYADTVSIRSGEPPVKLYIQHFVSAAPR